MFSPFYRWGNWGLEWTKHLVELRARMPLQGLEVLDRGLLRPLQLLLVARGFVRPSSTCLPKHIQHDVISGDVKE